MIVTPAECGTKNRQVLKGKRTRITPHLTVLVLLTNYVQYNTIAPRLTPLYWPLMLFHIFQLLDPTVVDLYLEHVNACN